jgi:DNA repair exonuclease SbcCD nuclease subunit
MKLILVVDPHVTKSNLEESVKLTQWVRERKSKYNADRIVWLGDQYDDFGIVHTEVLNFWIDEFQKGSITDVALIGNHDEDAKGSTSAMLAHKHQLVVAGKIPVIIEDCAFIGYIRDNDLFIKTVNELPKNIRYVFCHAEFDGAQFEGGFYTTHGIDLTKLPSHIQFISGHIHKGSQYANVLYPGTARWTIRSDANTPKGIMFFDTSNGVKEMIPTPKEIALPYIKITITPDMDLEQILSQIPISERTYLDFKGPQQFIDASYEILMKKGCHAIKTRSFPDREDQVQIVSESEGMSQAFYKFANHFLETNAIDTTIKERVLNKLKESVGEL